MCGMVSAFTGVLENVNMINNPTDTFAALRCTKEFMRTEFVIALLMYIR